MLKDIHKHIISELQQNARIDTVFVVTAVLYNLLVFGVNWGVTFTKPEGEQTTGNDFIFVILILATVFINTFIIKALLSGKNSKMKLLVIQEFTVKVY